MSKTAGEKKNLAELSVRIPPWLERSLKQAAAQDCRTFTEEAVYLLEVMSAVTARHSRFPLRREYADTPTVLSKAMKFDVTVELYDYLFHRAGEYGLKQSELARLLWKVSLDLRKVLGLKNQMLRKEDFIELILRKFQKQRIH